MWEKNSAISSISQDKNFRNLNKNYEWLIRERNLGFPSDKISTKNNSNSNEAMNDFYVYRMTDKIKATFFLEIWIVVKHLSTLI